MKKNVAYYRSSTGMQTSSIRTQKDNVNEFAVRSAIYIHEYFEDEAKSARKVKVEKRQGMSALIEAIKRDEVATLLVYKRDRLARNAVDYMGFYRLCKRHNVQVLFASDSEFPMMYTPLGEFVELIMAGMVQREAEQLAERMSATQRSNFEQGHKLRRLPYGIVEEIKEEGGDPTPKYVSDQIQDDIQLIFREFLRCHPTDLKEFTRHVNEDLGLQFQSLVKKKYTEKAALTIRDWQPLDLVRVLENTLYFGLHTVNFASGKVTYPRPECKIIEKEDWDKVQFILEPIRPRQLENPSYTYLLEDLVVCDVCSRGQSKPVIMTPKMSHHGGVPVPEYQCPTGHVLEADACHQHVIDFVIEHVNQVLTVHADDVYRQNQVKERRRIEALLQSKEAECDQIEQRFQIAMRANLESGTSDLTALGAMENMFNQLDGVRKELSSLYQQLEACQSLPHIVEAREKRLIAIQKVVTDTLNREGVKALLHDILVEVRRYRGQTKLGIIMKFPFEIDEGSDIDARA